MFKTNATMFWTFKHKLTPDKVEVVGAYPEDAPINYVFKLSTKDFSSYIVVQVTNTGLITREIVDQDELNFLSEHHDNIHIEDGKSDE
jgi:hypothetical protein